MLANDKPCYLIFAEEAYGLSSWKQELKQALTAQYQQFETLSFSLEENSSQQFFQELQTLSFFSTHRLLWLNRADKLSQDEIQYLAKQLVGATGITVVLVAEKKEAYQRLLKALESNVTGLIFSKPKPRDLPSLLVEQAKAQGKKMAHSTAQQLVDWLGEDLTLLDHQLKLLCLYRLDQTEILSEDIAALFGKTSDQNVFELSDFLVRGKRAAALQRLQDLLKQGENPLALLALVIRQYRLLIQIRWASQRQGASAEIGRELKLPGFVFEKLQRLSQTIPFRTLWKSYQNLQTLDLQLKSSSLPAEFEWANIILELTTQ